MGKLMSMTGVGRAQFKGDRFRITALIRSVNGKGLEISVRTPRELAVYDKEIRSLVKGAVHRGSVQVSVDVEFVKVKPAVRIEDLAEVVDEIVASTKRLGLSISDDLTLQLAFKFYNPLVAEEDLVQSEEFKSRLFETLKAALRDFLKSREQEGENLKRDIENSLNRLEELLKQVELKKDELTQRLVERLKEKAKKLLGEGFEKNPLLVQEIKLLLERSDVNEEVERLKSHIALFREELEKGSPVGKKLEFVAQEMLREVNTMGNKLPDLFPLNVEMKAEVDKIRQQVANVE
ncbi:MAG: YicC family protein [Aquificae bacterium]|nr:YicC family protein [Aquificota bacterium]